MAQKQYRYMGVKPFEATNRTIFFGRDEDIEGLFNLILSEKLVVLFGKSGYGKSSLLSAGILPLFQEEDEMERSAIVVEVRLGTYTKNQTRSPLQTTLAKLHEKLPDTLVELRGDFLAPLYSNTAEYPLWYHIKRRQSISPGGRFVIVFDQFEEFFSYPVVEQEQFKRELGELIYSDIPQHLRKRLSELTPDAKRQLAQPLNVKAVFAVRADCISLLDSMTDVLPAILHKRYELRSLTPAQAQEAIVRPAALTSLPFGSQAEFATPSFEFTEAAIQKILTELSSSQNKGVEAFQLQILCQYIESQIEEKVVSERGRNVLLNVDVGSLPDMSNLYETYYRRQLDRLAVSQQRSAQVVLEEGLLGEDLQSGEGRRMSVDSQFLRNQFAVDDTLLRALENAYLVRKEPNSVGGESLEISHDTLVAPVLKMKKERRAKEELAEAKRREREAKHLAILERRRRQWANFLAGIAMVGLLVAGWQYFKAKAATITAELATTEALAQRNAANAALQKVIAAHKEKMRNQIEADQRAELSDYAQQGRLFLSKIDSLEKVNLEPSLILYEIEIHLNENEK